MSDSTHNFALKQICMRASKHRQHIGKGWLVASYIHSKERSVQTRVQLLILDIYYPCQVSHNHYLVWPETDQEQQHQEQSEFVVYPVARIIIWYSSLFIIHKDQQSGKWWIFFLYAWMCVTLNRHNTIQDKATHPIGNSSIPKTLSSCIHFPLTG